MLLTGFLSHTDIKTYLECIILIFYFLYKELLPLVLSKVYFVFLSILKILFVLFILFYLTTTLFN